ncbi:sideroflexin-4 isoform X2 [Cynoglossus semilaevis]|uniref:sideroflexin-4 isoform X2 n=1 Tax=Cynoglossus semilaevis TaxID=244447 RepID=UPI000D62CBA4|nr:sideroflexin-4 isoform X2 [Cynoglossus semilaevis]
MASRVKTWINLLEPVNLFSSKDEIEKAYSLLGNKEESEKDAAAVNLAISSVHADTGTVLPLLLRPPAYLTILGPMAFVSFLPHMAVKPALFWQFHLQSYNAGFTFANRNSSAELEMRNQDMKTKFLKHLLMFTGTVSLTTVAGALPQIIINRLQIKDTVLLAVSRNLLPVPLSAVLAAFSVYTIRNEERETGVRVFDSNGRLVGVSQAAGKKAVRETALSRGALFGTSFTVPHLLLLLLRRTSFFQGNSFLFAPVRNMSFVLVLSLMIPVSFSLFPQLGTISRDRLEKELQAAAVDGQLFYHRGL